VRVERVSANGVTTVETVARTTADQELIDDAIDAYLTDAGLPPRPRGYAWILSASPAAPWPGVGNLSDAVQQAVQDAGSPAEPASVLAAGRAALDNV
jgi:hypothetical protein